MSAVVQVFVGLASYLVAIFLGMALLGSGYSPTDVARVCHAHRGVASVTDRSFAPGREQAIIVCRDGTVGRIKR